MSAFRRGQNANVKLQRLTGYGPIASFVSAGMLLVFVVLGQVALPASVAAVGTIVYIPAGSVLTPPGR